MGGRGEYEYNGGKAVNTQPYVGQGRRIDLDWLRIVLFLLLILFHVGMFYVAWPWHVKSGHAPVDWLRWPMLLMNPWRIPALFIISGIALRFALDKANSHPAFMRRRFHRLILPILFGMAVVCAPQAYFELLEDGVDPGNLASFYANYLMPPWASPDGWTTITPTWNHLWYVVYVLLLSACIVALSALLNGRLERALDIWVERLSRMPVVFVATPMLVSFVILYFFQNSVDAVQMVWGDWHRLANSLWLMLFGFAIAKQAAAWSTLWQCRWGMLWLSVFLGAVLMLDVTQIIWTDPSQDAFYYITRNFYSWAVMLALFAFVQQLPRGSDAVRTYLSDAVFPYYVLHQTVIIVVGVWLGQFDLGLTAEGLTLIAATVVITALLYHVVIRNMGRAAVLLGGKNPS